MTKLYKTNVYFGIWIYKYVQNSFNFSIGSFRVHIQSFVWRIWIGIEIENLFCKNVH